MRILLLIAIVVAQKKLCESFIPSSSFKKDSTRNSVRSNLVKQSDKTIIESNRIMPETVSRQISIAIVGSGYAGLAAAIEAGRNLPLDEKIIVLEKMGKPGGNSVMNAGQIAAVGTKQQEMAEIDDSVDLMMQDMCKAGVDLNHPNLIRRMIEESNDLVQWTERELNIHYRDRVTQLGGHSVPRTLSTLHACGNDIIQPMLDRIVAMPNVDLRVNTAFLGFVVEKEDEEGRPCVKGIRVKSRVDDHVETLLCDKGVILASGGFSADVPFRSIQNPSFGPNVMTTNQPCATAEVLKEALKIGAMSVQLSRIQLGPWTSPDEDGFGEAPFFCLGAGFPYGIIVDPESSKRFVNELGNRYERSMAILKMGHPVVCITDSDGAKHSLKDADDMEPAVKKFDSIADLAKAFKMNPLVLSECIDSYNSYVKEGVDKEFGKPFRNDLTTIDTPPFYAVRLWPKVHHCMGGLHINENAQVMHIDGYPIPGLYAAGEVAGGIHGGDRLGSCATLDCIAFGRIAGQSAVASKAALDQIMV